MLLINSSPNDVCRSATLPADSTGRSMSVMNTFVCSKIVTSVYSVVANTEFCSANKLHSVKPHLGYCSVIHLSRREAVILRRLRIGHTRVTHKYLLSGDSQPLCDKCQCSLTVKHILLECCSLKHVRENYFTCSSLKELFENVDATTIMDFIKRSQLLSSCLVVIVIFPFYISYWSLNGTV